VNRNDEAVLADGSDTTTRAPDFITASVAKPTVAELLETPGALLSRSHLRELGLERRAIDAVFRACAVVSLPGYARPLVRAHDYLALLEQSTYAGDRVRP
jgi:hypothetical protein